MIKQYAVDQVVEQAINSLGTSRLPIPLRENAAVVEQSISQWIHHRSLVKQRRSEWFNRLTEDDRMMIRDILEDCAEMAIGSFFTLLDGVGGTSEGVFQIVAIDSTNDRKVLNPENAEMLHDIFSDVCEEGRRQV